MNRPTRWQILLNAYTPEKRNWDRIYPWLAYVLRPLSFPVAWALMPFGVTANHVTFVTLLLGLGTCAAFAAGRPVTGAVLLILLNLFDCVDGDLARAQPPAKLPVGKFYDQLVGNVWLSVYFFMGAGFLTGDGETFLLPSRMAVLGGATTLLKCLSLHTRQIFWNVLGPAWESQKSADPSKPKAHSTSWYYRLYYNVTDIQAQDPLVLFFALVGRLDVFLALSFLALAGEFVFVTLLCLRRARRMAGTGK